MCNGCYDAAKALCSVEGGEWGYNDEYYEFCKTFLTVPQDQLCSKDAGDEYCLAALERVYETAEVLDVSSFRLVWCGEVEGGYA